MDTILDVLSLISRDKLSCFVHLDNSTIMCSHQDVLNITFHPEYIKVKGNVVSYNDITSIGTENYLFVRRGGFYTEVILDEEDYSKLQEDFLC